MAAGARIRNGFRSLFGRPRREADLDEEIRFHIESATQNFVAQGLSPNEARRRAMLEFGGVERAKEGVRDAWTLSWFAAFLQDSRFALRGFRQRPAYASTVVVTVALAIGAAGAIWNALYAVVSRPLPFVDDSSLVLLQQFRQSATPASAPTGGSAAFSGAVGLSPLEVLDYRGARSFSAVAEYHRMDFTLLGHGEPRRVQTGVVSPNYFALLGVRPLAGRDFIDGVNGDDSHDARPVLLLSYRFWLSQFQGDPSIVGADFTMNDRVHTVVGILPPLPPAPHDIDVWMPVSACPFRSGENWAHTRTARGLTTIARLAPGVTLESAALEASTIASALAKSFPDAYPERLGLTPRIVPLRDAMTDRARPTLWLLGAASLLVLLLVGANLVNLTLAQMVRREAEYALRAAVGGTRARLTRQMVTESTVLALTGGAFGLGLAIGGQAMLVRVLGRLTPRAEELSIGGVTVAIVLALALALGLAIGLLPQLSLQPLWSSRSPRRRGDLVTALRADGSNATAVGRTSRMRDGLVVVQVALSFVLLIGAALLLRSFRNLERVEPGFQHREVLTLHLPHNWTKYPDSESQVAYLDRLLDRVRTVPGVEIAAFAESYPLNSLLPFNRQVAIGRTPPDPKELGSTADFRFVSPDYFETVGVPLLSGRHLEPRDRNPEHAVALVNAAFVRVLFEGRDPLGREVTFGGGNTAWTIVGVVGDVHQRALGLEPQPELYAPVALTGLGDKRLFVRARGLGDIAGSVNALIPSLREAIRSVDPEQPITDVRTLEEARGEALAEPLATATLLTLAAAIALVIAAAGLAGLLAYSLGQRRREFGIRLALGATRLNIAQLVLTRTSGLVALGAGLGIGGALVATRGLDSMLFGLAATDPWTYVLVALVLLLTAFLACLPSLRRAVGTPPSLALRAM